jgi:hypothetical protein
VPYWRKNTVSAVGSERRARRTIPGTLWTAAALQTADLAGELAELSYRLLEAARVGAQLSQDDVTIGSHVLLKARRTLVGLRKQLEDGARALS